MTTFRHNALAALLVASSLSMAGATFSDEYSRFKVGTPATAPGVEVPEAETPEVEGPQLSPWLAGIEEAEGPENKAPEATEVEVEVEVPEINTRVSSFSVPSHLVPPIGQGYLLGKSNAFSSRVGSISEISASESLKVFVWSRSMDTTSDMRKNAYEVKFASGEQYRGELENLQNGYFAISLDFDGESGPLGDAVLSFELQDQAKNKFKVDSVVFTRTEAASHDGVLVENKAEDEAEVVLVTTNTTETSTESSCVPCSNDPSGAMAFNNRTCEEWRLTKTKCAVPSYSWRRDQVCKLSCFMYGHAYDEDKCCTDMNRLSDAEVTAIEHTPFVAKEDTDYEKRMRKQYNNTPCFEEYDCLSDRLSQNQPIIPGEAICSRDGHLMFGLDHDGSLQWKNCTAGEKKVYHKGSDGTNTGSFIMTESADFIVYNKNGEVTWELPCDVEVERHTQCYTVPSGSITYDCPYLHLHRGGNVALNYIDGKDWIAASINKFYTFRG